jgi:RNA polymerase sigma-70 factor (ECF subfamily)
MTPEVPYHLIHSAKGGDKQAFGKLIDCCSQYVYAVALKLLGDPEEARDAAQESFIKVWKNIGAHKSQFKFTTWLYTIVTNTCLDKLRLRSKKNKIFDYLASVDNLEPTLTESRTNEFEERQFVDFIRLVSGKLSSKQHSVFVLHDLEELSQDEVSKILGTSKGRVKSNLYYARKVVKGILERVDKDKISSNHEM